MSVTHPLALSDLAPEILLYIFSFLDFPELACIGSINPQLARLVADPALHRLRLLVVAPSRVSHALFALGPQGEALRPTVGDLCQRGVMRGPGIERKWRMGLYFYSALSVKQYETGLRLEKRYRSLVINSQLRRRASGPSTLENLHQTHIFPDVESSSPSISRLLLPVMHKLKWSIQRDRLSKMVRNGGSEGGLANWFEANGRGIMQDGERVRLALCPSVKKMVGFYEALSR